MCAYCGNDPINCVDPSGKSPDYHCFNPSIGVGGGVFSPQLSQDRYGHGYLGLGAGVETHGMGVTAGAGKVKGSFDGPSSALWTSCPTGGLDERELGDFMTGWALGASAGGVSGVPVGIGGVVGASFSIGNGTASVEGAVAAGTAGPSLYIGVGYTWQTY